jgi:hypothetical protein
MKHLALIAALILSAAPAMAQNYSQFPTQYGNQHRVKDPIQWTLEEMAQHRSYVTMPDGKMITCESTPDLLLGSTNVHCR